MKLNFNRNFLYSIVIYCWILYLFLKDLIDSIIPGANLLFYLSILLGAFFYFYNCFYTYNNLKQINIIIFFIVYAVYIIMNAYYLTSGEQRIRGLFTYIFYILVYFAMFFYLEKSKLKYLNINHILNLSVVISLLAIYEYISGNFLIKNSLYKIYNLSGILTYRAKVFSASPLTLSMTLACLIIVSFSLALYKNQKKYYIYMIINILGALATFSRGPLIAGFVGCGIVFCYKIKNEILMMRQILLPRKYIFLPFIIGIIVLFIWILSFKNIYISNMLKRVGTAFDFESESGNVARLIIWENSMLTIKKHFMFGIGIAATDGTIAKNLSSLTESGILKNLVETGLIGFILFYGFILKVNDFFRIKKDNIQKHILLTINSILIAILIENIILQVNNDVIIMSFFWILVAYKNYVEMNENKRINNVKD